MIKTRSMHHARGFALLIAIILTSVILTMGAALLDISYKQILLASSSKNSQYAFYNSDSALECGLYWDQKFNSFSYTSPLPASSVTCVNKAILNYTSNVSGNKRTTTFDVACRTGSGISGTVSIYKQSTGSTDIYANGYSTCDASLPTRIERGLKVHY